MKPRKVNSLAEATLFFSWLTVSLRAPQQVLADTCHGPLPGPMTFHQSKGTSLCLTLFAAGNIENLR